MFEHFGKFGNVPDVDVYFVVIVLFLLLLQLNLVARVMRSINSNNYVNV